MGKTFIITGGHSSNKGAQAMVFAVVQELKRHHPDSEIWMISGKKDESNAFAFDVAHMNFRTLLRLLLGPLAFVVRSGANGSGEKQLRQVWQQADAVFDVSGFSLSAQFGPKTSISYLLRLALAKKFRCSVYLLPQSFGPFNYSNPAHKLVLFALMKHYLKYPVSILPREHQGYRDLRPFTNRNLKKALDIVLLTDRPRRDTVFSSPPSSELEAPSSEKSVAIIPNTKIEKWNQQNDIKQIYKTILDRLLQSGFRVYVLRHSQEDLEFCREVAALAGGNDRVSLLEGDYTCIDLSEFIAGLDFVIASRYHSLVHAYKSGVPALVVGWAEKYPELMREFGQEQYYFDIRQPVADTEMDKALQKLMEYYDGHKTRIQQQLEDKKVEVDLADLFRDV